MNILITGFTGFIGKNLLFSLLNQRVSFNFSQLRLYLMSRKPEKILETFPDLLKKTRGILISHDISFPGIEKFFFEKIDFILHCAFPSSYRRISLWEMINTGILGLKNLLTFAKEQSVKKFLFLSSGVVYGRCPPGIKKFEENMPYGEIPFNFEEARFYYTIIKRTGEVLCLSAFKEWGVPVTIARCFSFLGPFLPLDSHLAVSNFIRDVLKGGPVIIESDGTKVTSYMYSQDMAEWLWNILFRGKPGEIYNVGSEKEITLKEFASKIVEINQKLTGKQTSIIVKKRPDPQKIPERYVPSTEKARKELGLKETVNLEEAIEKTLQFYHNFQGAFPVFHNSSR